MHASFQVHTWLSATLLYLMNLAAPMGITHITCNTETCSDCPWQGHPSTRDRLGTAELNYGIRCSWT